MLQSIARIAPQQSEDDPREMALERAERLEAALSGCLHPARLPDDLGRDEHATALQLEQLRCVVRDEQRDLPLELVRRVPPTVRVAGAAYADYLALRTAP